MGPVCDTGNGGAGSGLQTGAGFLVLEERHFGRGVERDRILDRFSELSCVLAAKVVSSPGWVTWFKPVGLVGGSREGGGRCGQGGCVVIFSMRCAVRLNGGSGGKHSDWLPYLRRTFRLFLPGLSGKIFQGTTELGMQEFVGVKVPWGRGDIASGARLARGVWSQEIGLEESWFWGEILALEDLRRSAALLTCGGHLAAGGVMLVV